MARTDLASIQSIAQAGLNPSFEAAQTDGHMVANDGKLFIVVKNGSGGAINVTLQTPAVVEGDLAVGERIVSIPASGERWIGRLTPSTYNQATGADAGKVYIDYAATTSMTVGAFRA